MISKLFRSLVIVVALAATSACLVQSASRPSPLAVELETLLKLAPGMTVAEIGSGDGDLTVDLARMIGERGHVYSTEIDEAKLRRIQDSVDRAGLGNVTVIQGGTSDSGLPDRCCDVIVMRRVYHHFAEPAAMNASLFRALRPGGRLAVVDFPPRSGWRRPSGVARDRDGHGVRPESLAEELEAAGFIVLKQIDGFHAGREFCVVARRPGDGDS